MSKEALALLEKIAELLYQRTEGYCPWCGAKDYPVFGDKQGYDEVKPEDAEEWRIEHSDTCVVAYIDQALAILRQQPTAGEFTKEAIELDKMCVSEIVAKYESSHNAIVVLKRKLRAACESDEWMEKATEYYENGGCPICFSTDESGCAEGCYLSQLQDRLDRAEAINNDLLKALSRYGHHDSPCAGILDLNDDSECICGFEAALAKAKKEQIPPSEGG